MPDPVEESHYCPACGYDQRGISSDRCPECGTDIDHARGIFIPWEQRKLIGYFRSFFRTLVIATFFPTRLTRATGWPMDLWSARLFRWTVRLLIAVPCLSMFYFYLQQTEGLKSLFSINGPERSAGDPFWEAKFLWTAGMTMWPVIPIGFLLALILATGVSHWLWMKDLELTRRNRAMVFSFYLGAPLAWLTIPAALLFVLYCEPIQKWLDYRSIVFNPVCILLVCLSGFVIVATLINSVRAISSATRCGMFRALASGVGILVQAAISVVIGLGLLPALAGLFRILFGSFSI
jgi:hypothetical protein